MWMKAPLLEMGNPGGAVELGQADGSGLATLKCRVSVEQPESQMPREKEYT